MRYSKKVLNLSMTNFGYLPLSAVVVLLGLGVYLPILPRLVLSFVCIFLDRRVLGPLRLPLSFPRNRSELWSNKQIPFINFLRRTGIVPPNSTSVDISSVKCQDTEPEKNLTGIPLRVTFYDSTNQKVVKDIFVKLQTGSAFPLWLQAIRAAKQWGVSREVDFYNSLASLVPVNTIPMLYAGKYPLFNRVCIVLEHLDIGSNVTTTNSENNNSVMRVIPDYKFQYVNDIRLILTEVAKMHAKFMVDDVDQRSARAFSWISDRNGLEFCDWIISLPLYPARKQWFIEIFSAISRYFSSEKTTLVHGDCRPGNMIFVGGKPNASEKAIFADWEAVNIAPPCWDVVYCCVVGLDSDLFSTSFDKLLFDYYSAYKEAYEKIHNSEPIPVSLESLNDQSILLTIVLFYFVHTIRLSGVWKNQGNTKEDKRIWSERVIRAFHNVDLDRVVNLLSPYGVSLSHMKSLERLVEDFSRNEDWYSEVK